MSPSATPAAAATGGLGGGGGGFSEGQTTLDGFDHLGKADPFAAVRVVSLHHIDALLYRRDILGLRIVSLVELSLLGATIASMRWFPYEVRNAETDANRPA